MTSDWQAVTCWLLPLGRMNSVEVSLTVSSSSGCLMDMTGEAGEAKMLCKQSMHISDMQQQASIAEWAARSHPQRRMGCLMAQLSKQCQDRHS